MYTQFWLLFSICHYGPRSQRKIEFILHHKMSDVTITYNQFSIKSINAPCILCYLRETVRHNKYGNLNNIFYYSSWATYLIGIKTYIIEINVWNICECYISDNILLILTHVRIMWCFNRRGSCGSYELEHSHRTLWSRIFCTFDSGCMRWCHASTLLIAYVCRGCYVAFNEPWSIRKLFHFYFSLSNIM